jgi:hypothetical protein
MSEDLASIFNVCAVQDDDLFFMQTMHRTTNWLWFVSNALIHQTKVSVKHLIHMRITFTRSTISSVQQFYITEICGLSVGKAVPFLSTLKD